jgi:nicotinamidase-related amidase
MKPKEALLVIDVQNYFINDRTKNIPRKVSEYIANNHQLFDLIIFTNFVNTRQSPVFRFLHWEKSVRSPDTDIAPELEPALKFGIVFSKDVLSALRIPSVSSLLKEHMIKNLYVCGIDTDSCVLATAYDAFDKGYRVSLLENLSMSHGGKNLHEAAVTLFRRNIGPVIQTK